MLKYVKITNFALIEESEVEFGPGFNVITGESGAGKSILIGAIGQLLGDPAKKSALRTGCDRSTISGIFAIPEALQNDIQTCLDQAGIPEGDTPDELTIRRVLTHSGVRNFINDTPVGARLLAEIGAFLVDRQQVNEQLSLTQSARQLELLDRCSDLAAPREVCQDLCRQLADLAHARAEFEAGLPDSGEADQLEQLLADIDRVNPAPDEDETLAAKCRLAGNSQHLIETSRQLADLLNDQENSVVDQLGTVVHELQELSQLGSTSAGELAEECAQIQLNLGELARTIGELGNDVDLNPEELAACEERLSDIYTLKRRYGPSMVELFDRQKQAQERLELFHSCAAQRQEFDAKQQQLTAQLEAAAQQLSLQRQKAAQPFINAVTVKLRAIGFARCQLLADFTRVPCGPTGCDKLELLFSANPGEAPRPLRQVASSGELSRLMLAFKQVVASADAVPSCIFDEIDMNIGGETANKVGEELQSLGRERQIICISHLAQVAVRADRHFQVAKSTAADRTVSRIQLLTDPLPELGRMLGGGPAALQHAQDLYLKK